MQFLNKNQQRIWKRRLARLTVLVCLLCAPRAAQAHGELLIRIADVTNRIKAATNNSAALYLERGELHREHREWDAAASDYSRAAQLEPNLPNIDLCRAKMLDDSGQLEAARTMFDKVVARFPENGEAFFGRARVRMKLGESKLAITDFQRGLKLLAEPTPENFLEIARALAAQKRDAEAIRVLDNGVAQLGAIVVLQSYALELELGQKQFDSVLARLDSIIEKSARKENWLARRGDILLHAGRRLEARKAFDSALTAISILPWRLQQASPMLNLQSRIQTALADIEKKCAANTVASDGTAESGRQKF